MIRSIGTMRDRVTIQSPTRTMNAVNEPIITWADVATVWASVTPIGANETVRARAAGMQTTHRVRMRFTTDLYPAKSDRRLQFTVGEITTTLNILGIVNVENRNRELEIMAVAAG